MKPIVSPRMRKPDLTRIFRELKSRGYSFPAGFNEVKPETLIRNDILYAIDMAKAPTTVFGFARVVVVKRPSDLRWEISAPDGPRPFLNMHWSHAFRWHELSALTNAPDQFAALTACLRTHPLTKEDLERLSRASPGILQLPMFEVDEDDERWEVEDTEEEPAPLIAEAGPTPTTRQPSLGRKITY